MIFDSRIKSEDDIFHYFNRKKAAQYIGKPGYFADYLDYFDDLDARGPKVLTEINDESGCFFSDEASISGYSYFIPEDALKPVEKKYRPYTLAEWIGQHAIGDVIRYRCKSQKIELRHMYVGYAYGIGTDIKNTTSGTLTLGVASYTMDYLLEDYEIEVNGEWLPFGVIDEQK